MSTEQFQPWLAALRSAGQLADPIPPATRGLKWEEPIEIEGDWTGAALEGSLRASPDGSVLATFSLSGPVVADGVSTWIASLAAGSGSNSTGALPADADADGVERFACMFRLTPSGGDKDLLFGGMFTVLGNA